MASDAFNNDLSAVLKTALELVTRDRAQQHGDGYDQHMQIANFWTLYLSGKGMLNPNCGLEAHDVAQMMLLMKVSRAMLGSFNMDNFVDQCGYSALTFAICNRNPKPEKEYQYEIEFDQ